MSPLNDPDIVLLWSAASGEDSFVYVCDHEGVAQCDSYVSYHQAGTCQEILEGPQEFLVFDGRRRFVETWTETHDCQLVVCLHRRIIHF